MSCDCCGGFFQLLLKLKTNTKKTIFTAGESEGELDADDETDSSVLAM